MVRFRAEPLPDRLRDSARQLPWVERAAVRLREQGRLLSGEVFVVPGPETDDLQSQLEAAAAELTNLDWRLHSLVVVPVCQLDSDFPAQVARSSS